MEGAGGIVSGDCPDLLNRGFTAAGRYVNWCSGNVAENGAGGRPPPPPQTTTTMTTGSAAAQATAASSSAASSAAVCGSGGHRSQQQQQQQQPFYSSGSCAQGPWSGWAVGGNNRACGCRSTVSGRAGGGPALGNGRLQKSLSFAFQNPAMWGGDDGADVENSRAYERRGTTASNNGDAQRWWAGTDGTAAGAASSAYQYATYRPRSRYVCVCGAHELSERERVWYYNGIYSISGSNRLIESGLCVVWVGVLWVALGYGWIFVCVCVCGVRVFAGNILGGNGARNIGPCGPNEAAHTQHR